MASYRAPVGPVTERDKRALAGLNNRRAIELNEQILGVGTTETSSTVRRALEGIQKGQLPPPVEEDYLRPLRRSDVPRKLPDATPHVDPLDGMRLPDSVDNTYVQNRPGIVSQSMLSMREQEAFGPEKPPLSSGALERPSFEMMKGPNGRVVGRPLAVDEARQIKAQRAGIKGAMDPVFARQGKMASSLRRKAEELGAGAAKRGRVAEENQDLVRMLRKDPELFKQVVSDEKLMGVLSEQDPFLRKVLSEMEIVKKGGKLKDAAKAARWAAGELQTGKNAVGPLGFLDDVLKTLGRIK